MYPEVEKIEYQTNEYDRDWQKTNRGHIDKATRRGHVSMRSKEDRLQKKDFDALCNLTWNDTTMLFEGNT